MKHTGLTPTTALAPTSSKVIIDDFLKPLLLQRINEARSMSPHYETLWQAIEKLYVSGGKRLRSYVTLLTFEAYSSESAQGILPAAAAQELLHIAMLIHDDIIDRDDIRYGVKNVASQYTDYYEEIIANTSDRQHYANSAAMLAGDLLISEAFILVTETIGKPQTIVATQRLFSKAIFQVIGGELLDTEAAFRGSDAASPLTIAELKTASYSFIGPLMIGATLAETSTEQQAHLKSFGEYLGIAYQLRDDMIGIFGNETVTGKSVSSDILEGKRTYLIEEFFSLANETQRTAFDNLFGRHDLTEKQIETVRSLLIESGAKDTVESVIDAYEVHCYTLLDALDIDEVHREAFRKLIVQCLKRDR